MRTLTQLLLAKLRCFSARGIQLIGLGRPRRFRIYHQSVAVPDHMLPGHAGEIAGLAIAVADGARIAGRSIDRTHNRAVRADTLKGIGAAGKGCSSIKADKGQGNKNQTMHHVKPPQCFGCQGQHSCAIPAAAATARRYDNSLARYFLANSQPSSKPPRQAPPMA